MCRIFKTLVRLGNFLNIEKILLMKMNFQETCRFVLRNAFKDDDPELTEQMLELYRKCPSMFEKVLTRVEQDLVQRQELLIEEFEVEINQSADADHVLPSAINAIPKAELDQKKHKHAVNDGKEIPRFPTHESAESCFRNLIRLAYEKDYAKPTQYPPTFQRTKLQWSRKFGFTDRYVIHLLLHGSIGIIACGRQACAHCISVVICELLARCGGHCPSG